MSHLYKLIQNTNEHMPAANGKWYARVHIDGFGTFKIGLSSKGASVVKDFSITENLKSVRVLFQPETSVDSGTHKRVRPMLSGLSFQNSADLASAKEVEERGKDEQEQP